MSDYTAIYEVGESIANLLRSEMVPEPIAKKEHIGICEPQSPEDFQLTVWVYNIEVIKDSGTRTGFHPDPDNPMIERFSPMQLKLQLLISAHSKAPAIQKYSDEYEVDINAAFNGRLSTIAFDGATKRNRPTLKVI